MEKQEAKEKFASGEITLYRDVKTKDDVLKEILRETRPGKIIPIMFIDVFYWTAKGASIWRGSVFNNSDLKVVKLSEII